MCYVEGMVYENYEEINLYIIFMFIAFTYDSHIDLKVIDLHIIIL